MCWDDLLEVIGLTLAILDFTGLSRNLETYFDDTRDEYWNWLRRLNPLETLEKIDDLEGTHSLLHYVLKTIAILTIALPSMAIGIFLGFVFSDVSDSILIGIVTGFFSIGLVGMILSLVVYPFFEWVLLLVEI